MLIASGTLDRVSLQGTRSIEVGVGSWGRVGPRCLNACRGYSSVQIHQRSAVTGGHADEPHGDRFDYVSTVAMGTMIGSTSISASIALADGAAEGRSGVRQLNVSGRMGVGDR